MKTEQHEKIVKRLSIQLIVSLIGLVISTTPYAYTQNKTIMNSKDTSWTWSCKTIQKSYLYKNKVMWQTLMCDGYAKNVKLLKSLNINLVYAPINDPEITFSPYQAQTANQLATLPDIANSLNAQREVIAGINGGYFYRNDIRNFIDNICFYKTFFPPKPNDSMGDSLLQYNGKNYATNCAFWPSTYQNPRAALILTGINPLSGKNAPYITLVSPNITYTQPGNIIPDAIGAGPNLVTNGNLTVNTPDENLLPTLEFAANSAVGIINDANGNPTQLVLFTVDGNDQSVFHNWPGMNAFEMGNFMLNYLKVSNAISMDQGGSTTLYVASSNPALYPLHVVSNSNFQPGVQRSADNIRHIYDGLFITVQKNTGKNS